MLAVQGARRLTGDVPRAPSSHRTHRCSCCVRLGTSLSGQQPHPQPRRTLSRGQGLDLLRSVSVTYDEAQGTLPGTTGQDRVPLSPHHGSRRAGCHHGAEITNTAATPNLSPLAHEKQPAIIPGETGSPGPLSPSPDSEGNRTERSRGAGGIGSCGREVCISCQMYLVQKG